MIKQIKPMRKLSSGGTGFPYVKLSPKMLFLNSEAVELVDALEVRGRGNNGFGSTGK